jgi:hypothetical protein
MPVPQLTPPGHLDQHSLLVALTPVLLCVVAAFALWLIGGRAGTVRRPLVVLATLNVLGALGMQGLFLLPWGPAAAYTEPLAGGLVRVGWWATGTAFALGCWATWYWRPWKAGSPGHPAQWCLRVALALAVPVVAVPGLLIAALLDANSASGRRCWFAGVIVLTASGVILGLPLLAPECRWWLHALALTSGTLLAARGPWAVPMGLACVAAVAS